MTPTPLPSLTQPNAPRTLSTTANVRRNEFFDCATATLQNMVPVTEKRLMREKKGGGVMFWHRYPYIFFVFRLTLNQTKVGSGKKFSMEELVNLFHGAEGSVKKRGFLPSPSTSMKKAKPTLLGFPNIAMRLRSGAEERGCGYRVKKARIYVQLQLQSTSCSRCVLRTRP